MTRPSGRVKVVRGRPFAISCTKARLQTRASGEISLYRHEAAAPEPFSGPTSRRIVRKTQDQPHRVSIRGPSRRPSGPSSLWRRSPASQLRAEVGFLTERRVLEIGTIAGMMKCARLATVSSRRAGDPGHPAACDGGL